MKEFLCRAPLRWGDMDATPQAFQQRVRCAMASREDLDKR